ncbi:hypothetical protein G7046_g768 [Stylonectria norvegica]|nr:hypothetical protein G7046_g768 [Stylonectria norvegica]
MCSADIFLAFLAILFPPLPGTLPLSSHPRHGPFANIYTNTPFAVWVKCGICSADSLINILLCVLGFIPGLLHAWYIIARYPEPAYEYEAVPDREGGRVTYVYVQAPQGQGQPPKQHKPKAQPPQQGAMNYGTQNAGSSQQGCGAVSEPGRHECRRG